MNTLNPVYTDKANCQDCFKCIRQCEVKAIAMVGGHAQIIGELCTHCGHCVQVCPAGAKKIRNDVSKVLTTLKGNLPVYLSLAPSWVGEFPGLTPSHITHWAKKAGFAGVSETALGAEELILNLAQYLPQHPGPHISSACPGVTALIQHHHPGLVNHLTPFYSPLICHAKILLNYGPAQVIFAGPCAAKKKESDQFPHLLSGVLTFRELRQLLGPYSQEKTDSTESFFPRVAGSGILFPMEGGMNRAFKSMAGDLGLRHLNYSGMGMVQEILKEVESGGIGQNVFLELLACSGGCLKGPGHSNNNQGLIARELKVENYHSPKNIVCGTMDIKYQWTPSPISRFFDQDKVNTAWAALGKSDPKEELNCGGCGYDSCLDLAQAIASERAEISMCVSRNRKLAQKKLSALVRSMPSAVVIANGDLKILECNGPFAALADRDFQDIMKVCPGLEGLQLQEVLPFHQEFQNVLRSGSDLFEQSFTWGEKTLTGSIFAIENGTAVGGVFQDITTITLQREKVINNTKTVIQKNLETVQKIAFLLGENAAETEGLLSSLLLAFGKEP